MGDIIEFRPVASNARRRRKASEATGECQILFFTGVRYERHAEPEAKLPARRTRTSAKSGLGSKSSRGKKRA